jgi:hypothetical protein
VPPFLAISNLPEKGAKIRKDAWRGVGVGKLQKKNQNKEK